MIETETAENSGNWDALDRHVAQRLRSLREARGITRKALAHGLGVSPRQLTKIEAGNARFAASHMYRAASFLGVDIAYFYEDAPVSAEEKNPSNSLPSTVDSKEMEALQRMFLSIPEGKARKNLLAMVKAAAQSRI